MKTTSSRLDLPLLAFSLIAVVIFLGGLVVLGFLSWDLPRGQQAQILATSIGAVGTLLLAVATFINIRQSYRRLELQEKDRQKALVRDELSNLICPAIRALERNIQDVEESEKSGCAYDWVYIDEPKSYNVASGPVTVSTSNEPSLIRLAEDDPDLAQDIRDQDRTAKKIGKRGSDFHEELMPEVERRLREHGVDEIDEQVKIVTNAVLQKPDKFKDSTGLAGFWEANRDDLIEYAQTHLENTPSDIKTMEEEYVEEMEKLVERLRERKRVLKQEFNISEDEIVISDEGEPSLL